jgi:hypothetical protein
MPNPIKYSTGTETLALKKGNFYIGTGDVGKGPSDTTGYYQGPSPASGGYVIYLNKSGVPGNLSYHSAANDAQLIAFTNNLSGTSFTSATECLNYYATQTDKVCFNRDYEGIVTNGLVLNVDAGFTPSYSRSGTTWYDVSSGGNNGTLTNGPTFNSDNGGSIVFDGADDVIDCGNNSICRPTTFTQTSWIYPTTISGQRGVFSSYYEPLVSGFFISILNSRIRFIIGINSGSGVGTYAELLGQTLNVNTWYQITISYDGTTMKIYVNGSIDVNYTWTSGIQYDTINNKVSIGQIWVSTGYCCPFIGKTSNLSLYNRALSAEEVLQNYNAQKGRFGL